MALCHNKVSSSQCSEVLEPFELRMLAPPLATTEQATDPIAQNHQGGNAHRSSDQQPIWPPERREAHSDKANSLEGPLSSRRRGTLAGMPLGLVRMATVVRLNALATQAHGVCGPDFLFYSI